MLAGYVGFQYVQKQKAIDFGEAYARAHQVEGAVVSVHPKPVSPYNWTVLVSDEHAHRFAHVNLVRSEPRRYQPGDGFIARIDSPYLPLDRAAWATKTRYGHAPVSELVREAWNAPSLGFFRWFADVPAFDGITEGSTCVWFSDLRFLTPGRDAMPFRFGACREQPGGGWRAYQRVGENGRMPLR